MKRPFIGVGLILASIGFASAGCSQTGQKSASSSSKPVDPSAWTDGDTNGSSSLAKSGRLSGGWSSESRDIEKSLGVGN